METGELTRFSSYSSIIRDAIVRPAESDEYPRWDQLVRQHHYLGFKSMMEVAYAGMFTQQQANE